MKLIGNSILLILVFSFIGSTSTRKLLANDAEQNNFVSKLMIIDADGSNVKELCKLKSLPWVNTPEYSPDGKKIALDGWNPEKGEGFQDSHIHIINADGTELVDLGDGMLPSWSPDMKKIVFSRFLIQGNGDKSYGGVWIMNADGTDRKILYQDAVSADWSPDGSKIVLATHFGTKLQIYNTQNKSTEMLKFPDDDYYQKFFWDISWSPDSKIVCFKAKNDSNKMEYASYHLPTKDLVTHFSTRRPKWISQKTAWHPSGNQVIFCGYSYEHQSGRIFSFDPNEYDEQPKLLPGQKYKGIVLKLSYRPDGKKIVFVMKENVLRKKPDWMK